MRNVRKHSKNADHKIIEVMSSDVLFFVRTTAPKPKYDELTLLLEQGNQQILSFENLESSNVSYFCL